MHREAGVALIAVGSCLCLVGIFPLRSKLWAVPLIGLLAAAGIAIGSGALLIQRDAGVGDWVLALTALAVLTPAHFRVLLGRLGRPPSG